MSTQDKLVQVRKFLEDYNKEVPKDDNVDIDAFFAKLKKAGGTTEDLLSELKWEEIERFGIPLLLAKKIATIFRVQSQDENVISVKKASGMSVLNLLSAYDLNDPTNAVGRELKTRSNGKKFIVIDNGNVLVAASFDLFSELQKKFPEREFYRTNGKDLRVYAVGEGKQFFADESPIYAGRPLRPDGTDDQLGRSWDGVSFTVRQLIYVAVNTTKELKATHQSAHDILDMALLPDAEKEVRERCQKASVLMEELLENGELPKLKISLTRETRQQDPFFANKTY